MGNIGTIKPEFSDTVRSIVDTILMEVMVALPAKIESYDETTQYADVQIQLLQGFDYGNEKYPVIPHVPVKHFRANGGKCRIHIPLKKGDDVTLIFSQRSLDNWKTQGGMSDPDDPRKHHITDAYALIGGSSIADAFPVEEPDAIEMVNEESTMQVFPDGTFAIKNGTTDLLSQVQAMAKKLSTDTTNTIFGPMPLNGFETYAEIAAKVQTLVNASNQGDEES